MKLVKPLSAILSFSLLFAIIGNCTNTLGLGEPAEIPRDERTLKEMELLARRFLSKQRPGFSEDEFLRREIEKFETRCPGFFKVNPKAIENMDHYLLAKNLHCINDVFDRYPNATTYFILNLQQRQDKFEIDIFSDHAFAAFEYKMDKAETTYWEPKIYFNPYFYSPIGGIPAVGVHAYQILQNINQEHFSPVDEEHILDKVILHEMGHWFELNDPFLPICSDINNESRKFGFEPLGHISQTRAKQRAIKINVAKITKDMFGYTGPWSISKCSELDDSEWFAEWFSCAMGSRKLNFIMQVILYWLQTEDEKIGQLLVP